MQHENRIFNARAARGQIVHSRKPRDIATYLPGERLTPASGLIARSKWRASAGGSFTLTGCKRSEFEGVDRSTSRERQPETRPVLVAENFDGENKIGVKAGLFEWPVRVGSLSWFDEA
jgi:hypothetical protein